MMTRVATYEEFLENELYHVFKQIEKSKNPVENSKWFVSEEARKWYIEFCGMSLDPDSVKEEDKFDKVFNPNS